MLIRYERLLTPQSRSPDASTVMHAGQTECWPLESLMLLPSTSRSYLANLSKLKKRPNKHRSIAASSDPLALGKILLQSRSIPTTTSSQFDKSTAEDGGRSLMLTAIVTTQTTFHQAARGSAKYHVNFKGRHR